MKTILFRVLACVLSAAVLGCESEPQLATVQMWLTDAPGDFESVRLEVLDIEIHRDPGDQETGWISANISPSLYEVLTLTNGKQALLGSLQLPEGRISQLRLKLSTRNSVRIGGETYALKIPSGYQSGIKLLVREEVRAGVTYKILLDFDVARSVVDQGNGSFSLNPVIRVLTGEQDGSIRGTITPAASTPAIYAILGTDTLTSTFADSSGQFALIGLPPGLYRVGFDPSTDYLPTSIEGVVVSENMRSDIGTVAIEK